MLVKTVQRALLKQATDQSRRRSFVLATLAALSNSNYLKEIQLANQFEEPPKLAKTHNPHQQPVLQTQTQTTPSTGVQEDGKIHISNTERGILTIVSGIQALLHPEVGFNIVNFGEATAYEFILRNLRDKMLETPEGRKLLRERPSFDADTLDMDHYKTLGENTLGYQYYQFTNDGDDRAPVKFIEDDELSYVFQRYRQIHDIVHILTKSKIDLAGELPVKAFEFGNTALPMTGLACFAWFKLSDKRKARVNMLDSYLNGLEVKPLVAVPWEELMERDVDELRAELGIRS